MNNNFKKSFHNSFPTTNPMGAKLLLNGPFIKHSQLLSSTFCKKPWRFIEQQLKQFISKRRTRDPNLYEQRIDHSGLVLSLKNDPTYCVGAAQRLRFGNGWFFEALKMWYVGLSKFGPLRSIGRPCVIEYSTWYWEMLSRYLCHWKPGLLAVTFSQLPNRP